MIILFQINNNEEAPRSSGVVQSDPTRICRRPRNFLGKALDLPGSEVPQEVKRDDYTHRRPRAGATALDVDGDSALFALAIGGLFYVKWSPYYARVFVAARDHTLGASIVSGNLPVPPDVGWQAGLAYSLAYLKAIWQAMVLGLVIGSGIEALLPRMMFARLFTGWMGSLPLPSPR